MSIKPPLSCPPNYSILAFRIAECKKAAVVKGITTLASLDLNSLFIPIAEHTEGTLTLKGNSEKILNIEDIAEYGPLYESYSFDADIVNNPNIFDDGTTHVYALYNEDNEFIESFSFTIDVNDPDYEDFPTALKTEYDNSVTIKTLISFDSSTTISTGILNVTAGAKSTKYRHVFTFDTAGVDLDHPGTLITPYTKYPKGRVKYILVFPDYEKVDVSTCGCADSSGDVKSNKKYFQYVNRGEYDSLNDPNTDIELVITEVTPTVNVKWDYTQYPTIDGHIGYHFNVNDLVYFNESGPFRANILNINGENVELDTLCDPNQSGSLFTHAYSPATPRWQNVGDFLFLSGATDIQDSDRCFIETIVLKNPHSFDIPLRYMIGR
jgi:hypothetical protein